MSWKILFKKQLFDLEVKGQGPTKVITVRDTPPYGHAPSYQISLTYLERQKSYGPDKLRWEEAEAEEKIRLKQYVSLRSKGRHNKRKAEILEDYDNNVSSDRKQKWHKTGNEEINELCWTWFQDAVQHRINVTGSLLKEMALKFSADLKIDSFKASNGWLDCFIKRHNRYWKL